MSFADISNILDSNLCMQCGACYVACPQNVIKFDSNGKVTFQADTLDICGSCNDCIQSCPGYDPETPISEEVLFERTRTIDERWTGIHKKLLIGHSTDPKIFNNSSSGGSTTVLLMTAMKYLKLDFIIVAGRDSDEPWKGKPVACNVLDGIQNFAQSTYQLFPYLWILKDLLIENPNYRIGIVGVACHIQALRKLQRIDSYWGGLIKSQVLFAVEVACSSSTLRSGTETLITNILQGNLQDVEDVKYRDGEYPGNFTAFQKKGEALKVPFWQEVEHFKPHKCHRCLSCGDWMSGLSDLSFCDGDPNIFKSSRNQDIQSDGQKFGVIFARTKLGVELLEHAISDGTLKVQEVSTFDESMNLGLQRKLHRRASHESGNRVIPLGPIVNHKSNIQPVSDDDVISRLSD